MATVKHRPSKSVYLRTVLYFRAFTRETLLAVMLMTVGIGLTLLTAMAVQVHSGRRCLVALRTDRSRRKLSSQNGWVGLVLHRHVAPNWFERCNTHAGTAPGLATRVSSRLLF
jgi:hypothetical protein